MSALATDNDRSSREDPSPAVLLEQRDPPRLAIVVPCYNEQEVLPETIRRLGELIATLVSDAAIAADSFVCYVDDGSRDRTWAMIAEAHQAAPDRVAGLKLAHNAGHQRALLAGMDAVADNSDCVATIDADLQDDIWAIAQFAEKYRQGYDVVYGVRRERTTDTRFKRWTALMFYSLMQAMGVDTVYNHADCRLLSSRALRQLQRFGETHLFLRGIVPQLGFPSAEVYYDREARFAGESKYPLKKMLGFATDGITSSSIAPIRWVTLVGAMICLLSVLGAIAAVVVWAAGVAVPSWMYILVSVWFLGGLNLLALGLVGEYAGKAYQESKRRPRYILESVLRPGSGGTS